MTERAPGRRFECLPLSFRQREDSCDYPLSLEFEGVFFFFFGNSLNLSYLTLLFLIFLINISKFV